MTGHAYLYISNQPLGTNPYQGSKLRMIWLPMRLTFFSLMTKNSGLVARVVTRFLYDLD